MPNSNQHEPGIMRKSFYSGIVSGVIVALAGLAFANHRSFIYNFSPWLAPVTLIGFFVISMLAVFAILYFFDLEIKN